MSVNDFIKALESRDTPEESFEGPMASFGADRPYTVKPPEDPDNPYTRKFRDYKYDFDHDIFVVYRPWNECARCWALYKEAKLPIEDEDKDYVCPHTRRNEYLALRRDMLHQGLSPVSCKEIELKNGVVQISISWLIPQKKEKKQPAPPRL